MACQKKMAEKMNARAQILAKLKAASPVAHVENGGYCPQAPSDLKAEFLRKAVAADANVHEIASAEDIPVRLESLFQNPATKRRYILRKARRFAICHGRARHI